MRVGVPKEIKVLENRVGLTPESVREIVSNGHEVIVEHNAGQGIGMDDAAYQRAGAKVVAGAPDVFAAADMIVKVKEPQAGERKLLKPGQVLFTGPLGHGSQRGSNVQPNLAVPILRCVQGFDHKGIAVGCSLKPAGHYLLDGKSRLAWWR